MIEQPRYNDERSPSNLGLQGASDNVEAEQQESSDYVVNTID